jgi:hypothetical protein
MHASTQHTLSTSLKGVELRRPFLGTAVFLLQGASGQELRHPQRGFRVHAPANKRKKEKTPVGLQMHVHS